MSMRGQLISKEYQSIVFAKDRDGKEYACYAKQLKDKKHVADDERAKCLDTSLILGDSW